MNIKRFKKILAIYIICFVSLCLFIPYNTHFYGDRLDWMNSSVIEKGVYIDQGFKYDFIFKSGYENQVTLKYENKRYEGYIKYEPHILTIIAEFAIITTLFIGISFITCKRESEK